MSAAPLEVMITVETLGRLAAGEVVRLEEVTLVPDLPLPAVCRLPDAAGREPRGGGAAGLPGTTLPAGRPRPLARLTGALRAILRRSPRLLEAAGAGEVA